MPRTPDDLIFKDSTYFCRKIIKINNIYCDTLIDKLNQSLKFIEEASEIFQKIESFEECGLEEERNLLYKIGKRNVTLYKVKLINAKKRVDDIINELGMFKKGINDEIN